MANDAEGCPRGDEAPPRVVIECVRPEVEATRFPAKRTPGEPVRVTADIFADGHDRIAAVVRYRLCAAGAAPAAAAPGASVTPGGWREAHLEELGNDRWGGTFRVGTAGCYEFTVEAWIDRYATWLDGLSKKFAAGQDVSLDLREGADLLESAAARAATGSDPGAATRATTGFDAGVTTRTASGSGPGVATRATAGPGPGVADPGVADPAGPAGRVGVHRAGLAPAPGPRTAERGGANGAGDAAWLREQAETFRTSRDQAAAVAAAFAPRLRRLMREHGGRPSPARHDRLQQVVVERERARFSTWYEMFPRSAGTDPNRSGTFADAAARLPDIAAMGFDVLYLPPIHPVGRQFRKGRDNALVAGPGDPGSPWAIGSEEGGHTAIEPGLGTLEDFDRFVASARRFGLEIALDLAFQASPDHPYVRAHPEWFRHRADGSVRYAENPPKQYQDIYPFDFESPAWRALWRELLEVTLFWAGRGIRIFRVDNPHTKPFRFWEWLIGETRRRHPDVLFLAEAFTRPKVMRRLAKLGFSQSYTYFTWRTTRRELVEYVTELTATDVREYLRANLFANTPDILHEYLQRGGRPAFEVRLLLAATLGASYGIYSGFELGENRAVPGTEEYEHSEKYEWRKRDWDAPGNIKEFVSHVNQLRRQHRALQYDWTLRFHETDNDALLAYSKQPPEGGERLLMVVNLDPFFMQHGWVRVPVVEWGGNPDRRYAVHDLLSEERYEWRGEWNYVRLQPGVRPGHILRVEVRG